MLQDKVALVTGASRGIGRGIALQLGQAGATVYITGRPPALSDSTNQSLPTLERTAEEIKSRGGKCIAVFCDHSKDEDVQALFEQIRSDQGGKLDILVNNAYSAVSALISSSGKKFWECPPTLWDEVNNVGLRNHYICSVHAARMMVAQQSGLIVNISSVGGLRFLFNPAYGIGKAACDRMAVDCAEELREKNVAFISLWPGAVSTELIMKNIDSLGGKSFNGLDAEVVKKMFVEGETTEYSGKCIVHLASDKNVMKKTGRIFLTADLGREYGFSDINNKPVESIRSVKQLLSTAKYAKLSSVVPGWLRIPGWLIVASSSKL